MMYNFVEYRSPVNIIFGAGAVVQLPEVIKQIGKHGVLITGKNFLQENGITDQIYMLCRRSKLKLIILPIVHSDPTVNLIKEILELLKGKRIDFIIGVGGGSVIDAAKSVSGLLGHNHVDHYLNGKPIDHETVPVIAVPTTAGTGSEVTSNAVLTFKDEKNKKSIRGKGLFPRVAILDPELTLTMPPILTAHTGLDALTQAMEALVSVSSTPITDALCLHAIHLINGNLMRASKKGKDLEARTNMLWASLITGLAFSNARLGAVHGIVHPLGAMFGIPHGLGCGILLPEVIRLNMSVAKEKYTQAAAKLNLKNPQDCIPYMRNLLRHLNVHTNFKSFGLKEELFPEIIIKSLPSGSLKNNPKKVSKKDIRDILLATLKN